MHNEFTAIIEPGDDGWWIARSPEVPAANGQGETPEQALADLGAAIELVLTYLREQAEESLAPGALRETITVG
jgi:predicted RNase H-like HicB family nuclease